MNLATTYNKGGVTSTANVPGLSVGAPDFFYEMARRLSAGPPRKRKEVPDYAEDQHRRKMMKLQEDMADMQLAKAREPAADQQTYVKSISGPNIVSGLISAYGGDPGAVYGGYRPAGTVQPGKADFAVTPGAGQQHADPFGGDDFFKRNYSGGGGYESPQNNETGQFQQMIHKGRYDAKGQPIMEADFLR